MMISIDAKEAARYNAQSSGTLWQQEELPPPLNLSYMFPFDDEPFAHLVATLQLHLALKVDGKLGPKTLEAITGWSSQLEEDDEVEEDTKPRDIEVREGEPDPEEEVEPPRMKIGAWTGSASLSNPERDVAFCLDVGIDRMDVILNDHSASRAPRDFSTHSVTKIRRLVQHAQASGLEVHFMSWVMPHQKYIEQAAEQLVPMCNELGIASLQWDAEEPWTRATQAMKYTAAAKLIADQFADLQCPQGVNGIGYTPMDKFAPLAEICAYVVPQCYATASSGLNPTTVVPRFVRRYRDHCGVDKAVEVGLAAYRQPPAQFTVDSAMSASFASAEATENCGAVLYWSLNWIRKNKTITKVIRKLAAKNELHMIA